MPLIDMEDWSDVEVTMEEDVASFTVPMLREELEAYGQSWTATERKATLVERLKQSILAERDARVSREARRLVQHALGVLSMSTWVAGLLQASAATKAKVSESQFRTAHTGGTVHAGLMLGMAGALHHLVLTDAERTSLVTWTAIMGWCNSGGYLVGALVGARGLTPWGGRHLRGGLANAGPFASFVVAMVALLRVTQLAWRGAARDKIEDDQEAVVRAT